MTGRVVEVWRVRTETSNAVAAELERILAVDERCRAEEFRFEHLRRSFVVRRGALRILLGCYLGVPPAAIQLLYGSKGKPGIAGRNRIEFSAAHSSGLAVFAFTRGCEIGIDVERIWTLPEMQSIAKGFFCSAETQELLAMPLEQRERSFFFCWTRKEAYVKATGDGLSAPLDGFRVSVQPCGFGSPIHLAQQMRRAKTLTLP